MIDGSSAYQLVEYDYREDVDPISGAPTMTAVPRTVQEAKEGVPYNTIKDLGEIFLRENLREAWRLLRRNDPFDYQLEVVDAIIYSCLAAQGWQFTVMQTRQSGKNEESAFIEQYLLLYGWYHGIPVSGVKFAPVHKPQVQASMDRLEGADAPDAGGMAGSILTKKLYRKSDGYKYHIGKPRDSNKWAFLSINPTANVASQTAFTLLEGDEAQDIDSAKWERDAQPMGSFKNATTVFWGVAWTKESHIYKAMQQSYEMEKRLEDDLGYRPKLVFKIDAHRVIASGNDSYKKAFENQVARLGVNHIAIQTQYLLNFVDSIGRYFDEEQLKLIFADSPYDMRQGPKPGSRYAFAIDVAGQEENPTGQQEVEAGKHKRDATQLVIGELMPDGVLVPVCFYQWVGRGHTEQRSQIKTILKHWGTVGGVCDATGIGEPLAYWLIEQLPDMLIEAYKFKAEGDENKSKLGYLVYATVQAGMFKMPKRPISDLQQGDLWDEAKYQLEHLVREARKAQKINYHVPRNAKPRKPGHVPHDDVALAIFMLIRAAWGIKDPDKWKASAFNRADIGG
ncbi:terminase [Paenibacillus agilis]|uniref:Terminase n=1 Tax=Paenibacillus agilis TaxID=3020863 RepID=A0A559IX49_9BACL|nr:terminase [Paenibacillus agilis]TVX92212.1 terminase [Paenibacillus agilis]